MPVKSNVRKKKPARQRTRELDVQIRFMEGLVQRDPKYVEALQLLGDHYTQRGRFAESLKVDEQLSELDPRNPLTFYNLACSYALNDQCDLAADALKRALRLGYTDFKWIARDPDLRKLRKHPRFEQLQEMIRRLKLKAR